MHKTWLQQKMESMTPQERKDFFDKRKVKQREAFEKRKALKAETQFPETRLTRLRNELVARKNDSYLADIAQMSEPGHKLELPTILKLLDLIEGGASSESIRIELHAENLPDSTWNNLKKYLFNVQVAQVEDLGLGILKVRRKSAERIEEMIVEMKERQKQWPKLFWKEILDAQKTLFKIESEMADILYKIGAVGEKQKGGTQIVVMNNIPRPPRDITPRGDSGNTIDLRTESDSV